MQNDTILMNNTCGILTSDINGSDVRLLFTPTASDETTIIFLRTLFRNTGSVAGLTGDLSTQSGTIDLLTSTGTLDLNT